MQSNAGLRTYHLFYEDVIIVTSKDIFTLILSPCDFCGAFILRFDEIICLYFPIKRECRIIMMKGLAAYIC